MRTIIALALALAIHAYPSNASAAVASTQVAQTPMAHSAINDGRLVVSRVQGGDGTV